MFGGDDTVEPRAFENVGEMLAIDPEHDFFNMAAARIERGDNIVAVFSGQRHEGIGGEYAVFLQNIASRCVSADNLRFGNQVAETVAALATALQHGDTHAGGEQNADKIDGQAPAAHDQNVSYGLFIGAGRNKETAQLLRAAGEGETVSCLQCEAAVGNDSFSVTRHDDHENPGRNPPRELAKDDAVKRTALRNFIFDHLDIALREGLHAKRGREMENAGNLSGAFLLGIDDVGETQSFPEKI